MKLYVWNIDVFFEGHAVCVLAHDLERAYQLLEQLNRNDYTTRIFEGKIPPTLVLDPQQERVFEFGGEIYER